MILHTMLTDGQIYFAADRAGVSLARMIRRGSRKADHAFDVILSGSGARRSQYATQDVPAATWDEWGIFLAEVYRRDDKADATYYSNAVDFHWQTGDRFRTLTPAQQHGLHRWVYEGRAATGSYSVYECRCGALKRVGTRATADVQEG